MHEVVEDGWIQTWTGRKGPCRPGAGDDGGAMDSVDMRVFRQIHSAQAEFRMPFLPAAKWWKRCKKMAEAGFLAATTPVFPAEEGAAGYTVTSAGVVAYDAAVSTLEEAGVKPGAAVWPSSASCSASRRSRERRCAMDAKQLAGVRFFGCWSPRQKGHHWYKPDGRTDWGDDGIVEAVLSAHLVVDGLSDLLPGEFQSRRGDPRPSAAQQVQGLWRFTVQELRGVGTVGVLACWDRTGDERYGSNTQFWVPLATTAEEAERMARAVFPSIWARLDAAGTADGRQAAAESSHTSEA